MREKRSGAPQARGGIQRRSGTVSGERTKRDRAQDPENVNPAAEARGRKRINDIKQKIDKNEIIMTEKRKGNNGRRVSLTAGACLLAAVTLLLGCSKEPEGAAGGDRTEIVPRVALPVSATAERVAVRSVADPSQEMTLWFLRSDETAS